MKIFSCLRKLGNRSFKIQDFCSLRMIIMYSVPAFMQGESKWKEMAWDVEQPVTTFRLPLSESMSPYASIWNGCLLVFTPYFSCLFFFLTYNEIKLMNTRFFFRWKKVHRSKGQYKWVKYFTANSIYKKTTRKKKLILRFFFLVVFW